MTLNDFVVLAWQAQAANPEWRYGQANYNTLQRVRPDLAGRIVAGNLDPFHRDERVPAFLAWVGENL